MTEFFKACSSFRPICLVLFILFANASARAELQFWVAGAEGVFLVSMDAESGQLTDTTKVSEHALTWLDRADSQALYGGAKISSVENQADGAIRAFRIEENGSLKLLNEVTTGGKTTIYVSVDQTQQALFATNFRQNTYTSRGSVVAFELETDGRVGALLDRFVHEGRGGSDSDRQLASHPHSIVVGPRNKYAAVADLGVDKLFIYGILPHGEGLRLETEIVGQAGQQPRHLAWHPEGRFLYCMNEGAPTVSVAQFDRESAEGEFIQHIKRIQNRGGGGADVRIDSRGRYLYGTNRGEDTIVIYGIDSDTGLLKLVGHSSAGGSSTRSIAISPDDRWLVAAHQASNLIRVFRIDGVSGHLHETSHMIQNKDPRCVLFR